ncbi:MAG TPA: hypothetical protein VE996_09860 [Terriglobales bacterium]|nr:hypothetical protein [Terriglobales bacterium]
MRRPFRLIPWLLLSVAVAALAAQRSVPPVKLHAKRESGTAVDKGFVQVFSHAAITLRDAHNRNALRTYTLSPELRQKLTYLHLDYGEPIKITYRVKDHIALRVDAKWKKGS